MSGELRTTPRQARSAQTVDQLLDAAERLFFSKGVVETSTVDIAKEAGVSVGRLYYWYPDKDAVLHAVMARAQNVVETFVKTSFPDDDLTVSTSTLVRRVLDSLVAFGSLHPGAIAVLQRRSTDATDAGNSLFELILTHLAAMIRSRVPDATTVECRLVALFLVRPTLAMLDEYLRIESPTEQQTLVGELHYLICAYLYARYPQPTTDVSQDYPIRPSRRATAVTVANDFVHPAVPVERFTDDNSD